MPWIREQALSQVLEVNQEDSERWLTELLEITQNDAREELLL